MELLSNLLWTLNFLNIICKVKGYADGNLVDSCESMHVNHFDGDTIYDPQSRPMPFEVEPVIVGPDLITVTLRSKDVPFTGFMLEARNKVDHIVGKFLMLDPGETRLLTCNGLSDSAVSHRINSDKIEFKVNWTSEAEDLDVTFRATIVQTFWIFWKPVDFTPTSTPSTTPGATNPAVTTVATTLSTTQSTTEHHTMATTQTSKSSTTKHSTVTSVVSTETELTTSTTVISSTTQPQNTEDLSTPSVVSTTIHTTRLQKMHIEKG